MKPPVTAKLSSCVPRRKMSSPASSVVMSAAWLREDGQLALAAGRDEDIDALFDADDALGRDDFDGERHAA